MRPGRTATKTVQDSLDYIMNPIKTDGGRLVSCFGCEAMTAAIEMRVQHKAYERAHNAPLVRRYSDPEKKSYILMTMRQSFLPGEVDADTAHEIGCQLAQGVCGDQYQYVVATHIDKHCIHNHITFNIVGSDMRRFHQNKYTPKRVAEISDSICEEYGLSIVTPNPSRIREPSYTGPKETTYREIIRRDIDRCLKEANSYEDFLARMEKAYYVKSSGKFLSFRHRSNGQQRNVRCYTLGDGYSERQIKERLATGSFTPQIKTEQRKKRSGVSQTDTPLSYSQMKREIISGFAAKDTLEQYAIKDYAGLEAKISSVLEQAQNAYAEMEALKRKATELKGIMDSARIVDEYGDVVRGLQTTLLPERYRQEHEEELELYEAAQISLKKHGMVVGGSALEAWETLYDETSTGQESMWREYAGLQRELALLRQAKEVMEGTRQSKDDRKKGGNERGK